MSHETSRPKPGMITLRADQIQGLPRPKELGQWLRTEEKPWWTEASLVQGGYGLLPDRITGCFIEPLSGGAWSFLVYSDADRSVQFNQSRGTVPPMRKTAKSDK